MECASKRRSPCSSLLFAICSRALAAAAGRRSGTGRNPCVRRRRPSSRSTRRSRTTSWRRSRRPSRPQCPEVEVEWVRDSTGVITARFLAEKDNPRADMVLGLAASSLLLFKKAGPARDLYAQGRRAAEADVPHRSDASWIGKDAFLGVICFNTVEGQKTGLKPPKSWKDLDQPKYKDKLVMPHPASSGTGYLTVAAWMQLMGEDGGLEVHGRPAPEHRRLHALGHRAVRAGRQGRARRRHLLRHARRPGEDRRRADRDHPGRGRASAGTWRPSPSSRARRSWTLPRRWPTGPSPRPPTSSTPSTTRSSRTPA